MRISDWSSDVCSSDLLGAQRIHQQGALPGFGAARPDSRLRDASRLEGLGRLEVPPAGGRAAGPHHRAALRSEEHTSELQSLMRISYAVFCLKTKNTMNSITSRQTHSRQTHTYNYICYRL